MLWRRTPYWVSLGGSWLALNAGYINAIGFLGAQQHGLTHVTGQVTRVGIELAHADLGSTFHAALLVLWFFFGSVLSGAIIRKAELSERGRRYGVAMLFEAGLLVAATQLMINDYLWGANLVAMAAGLQNAMATTYSGAVVRTTHMTGVVTDIGILIGHALRGHNVEWEKLKLLSLLLSSFFCGGVLGAGLFSMLDPYALIPPAIALAGASGMYFWLIHHRQPQGGGPHDASNQSQP